MQLCACDRSCDPPPGLDGICFRCGLRITGYLTRAEVLKEALEAIAEVAPRLRDAGVATVECGGFAVTLSPLPTTIVVPQRPPVPEHERALEAVTALAKARGAGSR